MKKLLTIVSLLACTCILFSCSFLDGLKKKDENTDDATPAENQTEQTPTAQEGEPAQQETEPAQQESEPTQQTPTTVEPEKVLATIDVFVTLSDSGKIVLAQGKVTVTDIDENEKFDINEVLVAAHKAIDAEDDYSSYVHEQYGLCIGKLLGDDSACFGYYVNDASAWSLADEVVEGDYVSAFVYADKEWCVDSYSRFNLRTANVVKGETFAIALENSSYDADWNTVFSATANAKILVNGEECNYVTDENGVAELTFEEAGTYVLSASVEAFLMVPPVCVVTVR